MKVELILPHMWAHPKNVTHQISLGKQYIHGNHIGLGTWAVNPVGQFCNVGVELFYTLHKLMYTDVLGLLEYVCNVVPLLLSRVVRKHDEKVKHHTVIK